MNFFKRLFKTKRIIEENGCFYPQKWVFIYFDWLYLDKEDGYLWLHKIYGKKHSKCSSLEEARQTLNKFKKQKPQKIYHYV